MKAIKVTVEYKPINSPTAYSITQIVGAAVIEIPDGTTARVYDGLTESQAADLAAMKSVTLTVKQVR